MNKRIFSYFNGTETVWADPISLERRWHRASEKVDIDTILDQFYGPEFMRNVVDGVPCDDDGNPLPGITKDMIAYAQRQQDEAIDQLLPVIYEMFGLKPIDPKTGEGTTEDEILNAFAEFQLFIHDVKKNTETTPNTPSSTPDPTSDRPTRPNGPSSPSTNGSADCDGTRTEQSESTPSQ